MREIFFFRFVVRNAFGKFLEDNIEISIGMCSMKYLGNINTGKICGL